MIWTAVGAIATTIAVIVALLENYRMNKDNEKNRKLQISLLRQQRDQKKLDEMVQNVMQLSKSLNSFEMMHYSSKFKAGVFREEDRRVLEQMTVENAARATDLSLQMEMMKNYESAKPMLDYFWGIWQDYGLWSISISTLFNCKCAPQEVAQEDIVAMAKKIVGDMVAKLIEINENYRVALENILKDKDNPITQAQAIMEVFGVEMTRLIQRKCEILSNKVIEFIRIEQKRIDDIVA